MIATTPDISVVICAVSEARYDCLIAAVASVQRQSVPAREIIMVIDHNPPLLERALRQFPGVCVMENHEAPGLGGARNSGLAAAQGAVVAFLDDDAVATPAWLEQLSAGYEDPDIVGVGGAIEPLWLEGRPAWFPEEFNWVVGCSYRGMPNTTAAVRNLFGCNMSFRRHVFDAVGSFRLGYGCDETEFCIRLRQQWPRKLLLYRPQAKVYHTVQPSRGHFRYFRSRCYFEGRSKAVVSWLRGASDALDAERRYTMRTLPRGIIGGVTDAAVRRDRAGLARAGAIMAGLTMTTAGYLSGRIAIVDAARERGWSGQPYERTAGRDRR